MDFLDSRSPALSAATSPTPPIAPTNEDIEAVIQMATSSRSSPDGRAGPAKDTRTQLFVGNLPYRVRWQDLKDLFRKAGTVLRADVSLGPDNRSRGHGTVLLASAEDAGRAIDMFNGYSWQTRILEVRPDRLPQDLDLLNLNSTSFSNLSSPAHFVSSQVTGSLLNGLNELDYSSIFGLDRPSSSSGATGRNLFVGNLPFHCQWQDLKDLFRQAGTIIRADVALGQDGRSRGFGTVVFATEYDAECAVKMFNGYEYNGRVLKVHYDKFSQSTQPMTTPASPALNSHLPSSLQLSGKDILRPNHIMMPPGYTLDLGPASAPGSPYDYPPQLQMSVPHPHHTHSHLQQPQPTTQNEHSRLHFTSEVGGLSSSLRSVHVSDASSHSGSSSDSIKPSDSIATSESSRTSPSLSERSAPKSPLRKSRSPASPPSMFSHHHSHPHHPGTISIPPPTAFSIPGVHNMSPMGIPVSLYYPGMSPLHHPAHAVPMTPHGLPPITPSMPPFTFLPPIPMPSPHAESSLDTHTPTYQYPAPPPPGPAGYQRLNPDDKPDSSSSAEEQTTSRLTSSVNPYFQPPTHQPPFVHARPFGPHQLTPFSPGLAMSPGAFWGRPGVAGAGPNPFINPAVGAPVHVANGSSGPTIFYHPHPSPGVPDSVGVEMGSRGGAQPGGYFDSLTLGGQEYFPPMPSYFGSSTVEGEILKDKKEKGRDEEEHNYRERVFSGPTSPTSGSGDSTGGTPDTSDQKSPMFMLGVRKEGLVSRTHSMSTEAQERPQLHRPDSDPSPTTMKTLQGEGIGEKTELEKSGK